MFFFLLIRRPPRSTRTDTLFPYTTRFRSIMALLWQRAHGEYWMSAPNRLRFVAFSLAVIAGPRKTMPPGRHFMTSTDQRSEEHTSELQSLMRNSYAVFCLKKKTNT